MKSKEPKVSVIVALYKSEPFMRKLVDSILSQTYRNIEVLLIDDGSPDNCGVIADNYAKKDKRVVAVHKKNGGACEARNVGLEKMTGEYVTIIDGDDWLEPDYVEYFMNIVSKYDADYVISDKIFTTRDRAQTKRDEISIISPEEAAVRIIYPIVPIGPWNKLFSTKLIKDNNLRFDVPWSGEGLYFTTMAAQLAKRIGYGHRKVYNYRLNNTNSGLTKYNLTMGTNALWNIKNIQSKLIIKTDRLYNATNWHIWKNYNFVLKLIIATNGVKKEKQLYNECKSNIRKMALSVAIKSEFNFVGKIKILIRSLFPVYIAKASIKKERQALMNDKME